MDTYKLPIIGRYFQWLQKGVPTGEVEKYPALNDQGETTLEGVYVAGDLTGVPLLKLAAESGAAKIKQFCADPNFKTSTTDSVYDVIIVGAGPAGLSAALECQANSLKYVVLESNQVFNTIENFPKAKPILAKPDLMEVQSQLPIKDGIKEGILEEWKSFIQQQPLALKTGIKVQKLSRKAQEVIVETQDSEYHGQKVLLCIGKSGDARKLGCVGDDRSKVLNRLFDPADYQGQEVMVVGGGDSALEAANALAESGAQVTHSYRKSQFSRPKEENLTQWNRWVNQGQIRPILNSSLLEVQEDSVKLKVNGDHQESQTEQEVPNEVVFALIGRELPVDFFRRSSIQMEGEKNIMWWVNLTAMVSFFTMLYFGKKGLGIDVFDGGLLQSIIATFTYPLQVIKMGLKFDAWMAVLAWLGFMTFVVSGSWSLYSMIRLRSKYFSANLQFFHPVWMAELLTLFGFSLWVFSGNPSKIMIPVNLWGYVGLLGTVVGLGSFVFYTVTSGESVFKSLWPRVKYTYLTWSALFFTGLYLVEFFNKNLGWSEPATYWYSFLYCTTMALFGARRAYVKPTGYIKRQMWTVNIIQTVFLFLLPFHLYDLLLKGFEGTWWLAQLFPQGKWSSFGYILFWPLNLWQFGTSTFWTIFPFVQTFGFLWYIVYKYGKGAYCGWICSCGGMAESLGDEYRSLAPHGPKAKRWENIGQVILAYSFLVTLLKFLPVDASYFEKSYVLLIDILFAGVLGLGVYFFMGGRVWCRYGCPLASLMHIYTRFSKYRIVSEKKACISCNSCTKVCHMGIDVMNFANKGIPMNDVECVRCSSCIESCPMDVLSFAETKVDPDNLDRTQVPAEGKVWWGAGIK